MGLFGDGARVIFYIIPKKPHVASPSEIQPQVKDCPVYDSHVLQNNTL